MSRKRRSNPIHEAVDGRSETDFPSEDFDAEDYDSEEEEYESEEEGYDEPGRSRMAREAKIGLGVIFVVLVGFGVYMYSHLSDGDESPDASTAEAGAEPEASENGPESKAPAWDPTPAFPSGAEAGADVADDTATGGSSWGVPAADQSSGPEDYDLSLPAPAPSFPETESTAAADRQVGYRGYQSAESEAPASLPGQSAGDPSTGTPPPRDPFPSAPVPAEADIAQPVSTQPGAAQGADDAGGASAGDTLAVMPPAEAQPLGSEAEWSTQQNPLRTGESRLETTADAASGSSSTGSGYAYESPQPMTESGYAISNPQSAGDQGAESTARAADPPATFQEAPYSGSVAGQADLSASAPEQPEAAPQPGASPSPSAETAPTWSSGSGVAQTDPTRPGPDSQPAGPAGLADLGGRDEPAAAASPQGTYVVQPNDNFWTISEKLYETGAYFKALAQHNLDRVPNPNRLPLGAELLAPDVAELQKAYPDLCPKPAHREADERRALAGSAEPPPGGRIYLVQEGDNLFNIARYELGGATRWTEIVNLNKERLGQNLDDLNYLTPGMKLVLPDDRPAVNVGQQPGQYPR